MTKRFTSKLYDEIPAKTQKPNIYSDSIPLAEYTATNMPPPIYRSERIPAPSAHFGVRIDAGAVLL
jgi:hypothetical protein